MKSPLQTAASNAIKAAVDFFMPIICVHCNAEGEFLCARCVSSISKMPRDVCRTCAEPTSEHQRLCGDCITLPPPIDRLEAAWQYGGAASSAIQALKYRQITAIARVMSELMVHQTFSPYSRNANIDCVVPVPSHRDRLRERGYNQAALLAQNVAESLGMRFIEDALTKTRATSSQVDLSRQERKASLRNAFAANYNFEDARVLLVDDVCTTGSTLMNCAVALKRAGAQRVSAVVFAKEIAVGAA